MFVARRIANVKGRIKTPTISKTGITNFKIPWIPIGKKCLNILNKLFLTHNNQPINTNKNAYINIK